MAFIDLSPLARASVPHARVIIPPPHTHFGVEGQYIGYIFLQQQDTVRMLTSSNYYMSHLIG